MNVTASPFQGGYLIYLGDLMVKSLKPSRAHNVKQAALDVLSKAAAKAGIYSGKEWRTAL